MAQDRCLTSERDALVCLHDDDAPVAQVVSDLTELGPLAIVAGGVLVVLLALRRWRDAAYVVAAVGVVWAVNPLLKELFHRPRPDLWALPPDVSEYSFPSGHAANTAALVGAVVLILRRRLWAFLGAAVLLAVGLSQLVLGRHYPSDVLAGWLWALVWVALVRIALARITVVRKVTKGGPG